MSEPRQTKQITVRFDLTDWVLICREANEAGIKPVQYVRSAVLMRLNGSLIDTKSIDAYIQQQLKDDNIKRRGF